VGAPPPTSIRQFDIGSVHRLAVLVTDPDSGWLGLARGLKAHGIPFTMTTSVAKALQHKVVFVYPTISGRALPAPAFAALAEHVHAGGSLLAFDVEGGGLAPLFGVAAAPTAVREDVVDWPSTGSDRGGQTRISRSGTEASVGAVQYQPTTGETLAHYASGGAALVCHRAGGRACAFGVDLGALSARAYNGRVEGIAQSYVNSYEPSLDTLYDWLAAFYTAGEPMPWLIGTAPAGRSVSIILSHDVDSVPAIAAARDSADAISAAGAKGTFFVQTKYVRDFNDSPFFDKAAAQTFSAIARQGMELGSHSVAHAQSFKAFPFGTGEERYPNYRPFVESRTSARGGSILGELRISKFLLETLTPATVRSFRAGYLSNPFRLPDGLAAAGYRFDSSITANSTLSHYPFQLTYGRADNALAPAYEFPVTIEDEAAPGLIQRRDLEFAVIDKIAERHGLVVVLVHPDAAGVKLSFERDLLRRWQGRAWFASLGDYGAWWRARSEFEPDIVEANGGWRLVAPRSDARDITLILPKVKSIAAGPGAAFARGVLTLAHSPNTPLILNPQ